MKRLYFLFCLLCISSFSARAQDSLDWDIDQIFEEQETPPEEAVAEPETPPPTVTVTQMIQRRGMQFSANYDFTIGVAPGWYATPWDEDWDGEDYYLDRAIKMRGAFGLDAQIHESFRVKSNMYFDIPDFAFRLGDFFFDYKIYDKVFIRAGKYGLSWGISPNYGFTNLLSRIPKGGNEYDSFIFKADIPVGKGGFQFLTLTRFNLMVNGPDFPHREDFGVGGKYNFALRLVDLDFGVYYQEGMVMRSFLSAKTTLWNTEFYSEGLAAVDIHDTSNMSGAWNIGFGRSLLSGRFNINGELFYNDEHDTYWYHPETKIRQQGSSPFIEGFNIALNMMYRLWDKGNLRFYLGTLYAPSQKSARFVPGLRLNPLPSIELYFAVPMTFGEEDGYYYKNTVTTAEKTTGQPLPFAVLFMVTLSGGVQFGHYY